MARSWIPKGLSDDEREEYIKKNRERTLKYYYEHREELIKKRVGYMKQYYQDHKEKWERNETQKEHRNRLRREKYANDPEYRQRQRDKVKEYVKRNPRGKRSQRLKVYGLTIDSYEDLFNSQDRKCAICGYSTIGDHKFFPMIDHCHDTGEVRGILCANCNMALGKFKDDINLLKSAIDYLERSNNGKVVDMVSS